MIYSRAILFPVLILLLTSALYAQTPEKTDSPELVESRELTSKVVQLYREHKYDDALPMAKRALELAELTLGKNDARLISLLVNLGDVYVATLKADKAKELFERALAIGESNFGREDLHLTRPLDELGNLLGNKGDYNGSAAAFSRSLGIKSKLLKPGAVEVARANFALADSHRKGRDYAKAETYYQEAIRLYNQLGDANKQELVEVLQRYLIVLTAQNRKDEAALIQTRLMTLSAEAGVVEGGVVNGWAVKLVQPEYPAIARGAHASGQVAVQVLIDENGKVISALPLSGHPLLQSAALEAAKASKFTPTFRSGVAVKVRGTIIYNFFLR